MYYIPVGVVDRQKPAEQSSWYKEDEVEDGHAHCREILVSVAVTGNGRSDYRDKHVQH